MEKVTPKGAATAALTKIRQEADEPYSSFVSRLTEAAERMFGIQEPDNPFFKQLAFENANPVCQDLLRHHCKESVSNIVHLCAGAGTSHAIGLAIGVALQRAGIGSTQKLALIASSLVILPKIAHSLETLSLPILALICPFLAILATPLNQLIHSPPPPLVPDVKKDTTGPKNAGQEPTYKVCPSLLGTRETLSGGSRQPPCRR